MKKLNRYFNFLIVCVGVCIGMVHSVLGVTTMSNAALGVNNSSVIVTGGKIGGGDSNAPVYIGCPRKFLGDGQRFRVWKCVLGDELRGGEYRRLECVAISGSHGR